MRREDSSAAHRVSQIPRPPNREAPQSAAHERTADSVRKPTAYRKVTRRTRNLLRAVNSQQLSTSSRERHAMGEAAASRHGSKLAAHPPF